MDLRLPTGKYVVAVSGGVDSVVLLDLLRRLPEVELTVAHFDHGIRPDSEEDRQFVKKLAENYELPFVYDEGKLGPNASEATARQARYKFLRQAQSEAGAKAIITAHHQDDVLETAIINLLRGTGRRGLSSLGETADLKRPLLKFPKKTLLDYARRHNLVWREDSTNADTNYLRNYIRHNILPKFSAKDRNRLLKLIEQTKNVNITLEAELDQLILNSLQLNRKFFNSLPHDVARETMAAWLRQNGIRDFDRKTLERLVAAAKIARAGSRLDVRRDICIKVEKQSLALRVQER
jgi:tRNA(Ile)-lysidine synthetase-like protein